MQDLLLPPGYKRLSISEKTERQYLQRCRTHSPASFSQFETLNFQRSSLYNYLLDMRFLSYYMHFLNMHVNIFLYFIFKTREAVKFIWPNSNKLLSFLMTPFLAILFLSYTWPIYSFLGLDIYKTMEILWIDLIIKSCKGFIS